MPKSPTPTNHLPSGLHASWDVAKWRSFFCFPDPKVVQFVPAIWMFWGRELEEAIAEVVFAFGEGLRGREGGCGVEGCASVSSGGCGYGRRNGCSGYEGRGARDVECVGELTSRLPGPSPRTLARRALGPSKTIKPIQILRAHARLALFSPATLLRLLLVICPAFLNILQIPEIELRLLRSHAEHRSHMRCVQEAEAVIEAVCMVYAKGEEALETCGAGWVGEGGAGVDA